MPSVPIKDRKFDTQVQYLKYKVLREVARYAFEDRLLDAYTEIPKLIVKDKPTMRCCIYKERAIVEERIKLALGGDKNNPNVIEVIDIACDECPMSGYNVSDACRGNIWSWESISPVKRSLPIFVRVSGTVIQLAGG